MDEIRDLLEVEIKKEIKNLSNFDSGSKEKAMVIDDLAKLCQLRIEESKSELEHIEKRDESAMRGLDQDLKRDQLIEQTKDRYLRLGIEMAGIIVPIIFYATWMRRGFRFEETGTYTSTTFRGLFNRFKPTNR